MILLLTYYFDPSALVDYISLLLPDMFLGQKIGDLGTNFFFVIRDKWYGTVHVWC